MKIIKIVCSLVLLYIVGVLGIGLFNMKSSEDYENAAMGSNSPCPNCKYRVWDVEVLNDSKLNGQVFKVIEIDMMGSLEPITTLVFTGNVKKQIEDFKNEESEKAVNGSRKKSNFILSLDDLQIPEATFPNQISQYELNHKTIGGQLDMDFSQSTVIYSLFENHFYLEPAPNEKSKVLARFNKECPIKISHDKEWHFKTNTTGIIELYYFKKEDVWRVDSIPCFDKEDLHFRDWN